jgi:3-methyladenine DNA glycosylase AlkD
MGNPLSELQQLGDAKRAKSSEHYFEAGSNDVFLGVRVPQIRTLEKEYCDLPLSVVLTLLHSEYHEARLLALFIMADQLKRGDEQTKEKIVKSYLANTAYVNNWDLVDASAASILGAYLINKKKRDVLYGLVTSSDVWERRISVVATFAFIRNGDITDAVKLSTILLPDHHHYIHKAVGWVMREVVKKDEEVLVSFLKDHYMELPRTTLRYAIERFDEPRRKRFLHGDFSY